MELFMIVGMIIISFSISIVSIILSCVAITSHSYIESNMIELERSFKHTDKFYTSIIERIDNDLEQIKREVKNK